MYKFEMYKKLQNEIPQIYEEARRAADEIGIPKEIRGSFGLTGAISGCPAPMREDIEHAVAEGGKRVIPLKNLVDEIRAVVKDVYGDGYDAAPVSTCEAGLWTSFDTLVTPPMQGRGDNYRARYIALYEKHLHHQGGYGRPFPGKYKDILADRGSTPGELGFYGKRQNNTDVIYVKLEGGNYDPHGIKYFPTLQLTDVDVDKSISKIRKVAERHATMLTGLTSLGYDTPGYGYGDKTPDGTPRLQVELSRVAQDYDIPYIVDNAWGLPFLGTDIRKNGASVMIYSMDKATGSPTSGLIIGKEEEMIHIRRALGYHSDRWGTTASYGKAAYVAFDPGKEALLGQIAALKALRDRPDMYRKPLEETYQIIKEEFERIHPDIKKGLKINKSYNSMAVEINYEDTWKHGGIGLPIFPIEDMYASTNIFQSGLAPMGIIATIAYDGNIFIEPGLGTTDGHGNLIHERMQWAVRGLVRLMEIVATHAGMIKM